MQEMKTIITARPGCTWELVPRRENMDFVADLGFNLSAVRDELLGLSVDDYGFGPIQDRDQPGDFWVFGKRIGGREAYIKLKVASFGGLKGSLKALRVVSFHEAEQPLPHPFS